MYKILAINPGSTSTKIALYEDEKEIFSTNIEHDVIEIGKYEKIADQLSMRKDIIEKILKEEGFIIEEIDCFVGRGGLLPPIHSGAYEVDEKLLRVLEGGDIPEHASNLGGILAHELAKGRPSYIYDAVSVDEMIDIAKFSGSTLVKRKSFSHILNSRAMAIKLATEKGKNYEDLNFIVAHLGGGISSGAHEKGRLVDIISDDEGPFSPERAGRVPCLDLAKVCFSGKYSYNEIRKRLRGKGGLIDYLGTSDAREVEQMINDGDENAKLIYEAMAYQIAKGIGELATVLKGNVDYIILTGGIAHSKMLTSWIIERVNFIGECHVMAGEKELESLAYGALRVMLGKERANKF